MGAARSYIAGTASRMRPGGKLQKRHGAWLADIWRDGRDVHVSHYQRPVQMMIDTYFLLGLGLVVLMGVMLFR